MRYAVLAGALAITLCAGICEAEDGKVKNASAAAVITEETESGTGLKHIDTGDSSEEPVTQVGTMGPGESYDENTGFPDVVESDSSMDTR
ncbi:MAG: hypothetical protein NTY76_04040 [Candidatus Omnitrophica bacterium]|nr:hypothetical protein [Candidatus Omnitrophota bacterium]